MAVALRHSLTNYQACPEPAHGFLHRILDSGLRLARLWRMQRADLRTVELLDERDLRDIGVSRWELRREVSRPFWRG